MKPFFARKKDISRVCCAMSPYTLLQYLLISTVEDVRHTYFFFPVTMSPQLRGHFPNRHVFYYRKWCRWIKPILWVYWYVLKHIKDIVWPFLCTADIFAEDQQYFCWLLLHGHEYTLLEDGVGTYFRPKVSRNNFSQRIESWLFRPLSTAYWGQNDNCIRMCLSHPELLNSPHKSQKVDLRVLWERADAEKRSYIMSIYELTESFVSQLLNNKHDLILTQPYSEIGIMSEEEKCNCYRSIIMKFDLHPDTTLIKVHPQEKTDYESAFPKFSVCKQKIPVELFSLLSNSIVRVFTLTSTGVFVFAGRAEIFWFGSSLSPAMQRVYGDVPSPISKMIKGKVRV